MSELHSALDSPNVRAFLRAIRLGEGTADEAGYRRLVSGGEFDDFGKHPRKRVWIPRYRVWSTAAGAYQIIAPTWDSLVRQWGFENFGPTVQDLAAVALIKGRGALPDVVEGRLREAVRKCAKEWASLPGSPYGQRTESMARVEAEYVKWGGVVAEEAAPIVESKSSWEAPMSPFLIAALPELVKFIPGLIRSFGSEGKVTERNAKAAEAVLEVVQVATGAPNAQAAIEAVAGDVALRAAATQALDAENWFESTEAGGGGIDGARKFNLTAADGSGWKMPALWVTLLVLPLVYQVVWAVLFIEGFSNEMKGMVIGIVMTGALGSVLAFWLGSSFGSQKKDAVRG